MSALRKVLVPLAPGFEELEAVTVIDVLRRAGIDVVLADLGTRESERRARGSHDLELVTNTSIDQVDFDEFEALVLAGGIPGATTLRDDARVIAGLQYMHARGRWTAAICAGPIALAAAGLLDDERATAYPAFRDRLGRADVVTDERVVISGRVMTSVGPGTALDFALCLVGVLCGPDLATEIAEAMIVEGFADRARACKG